MHCPCFCSIENLENKLHEILTIIMALLAALATANLDTPLTWKHLIKVRTLQTCCTKNWTFQQSRQSNQYTPCPTQNLQSLQCSQPPPNLSPCPIQQLLPTKTSITRKNSVGLCTFCKMNSHNTKTLIFCSHCYCCYCCCYCHCCLLI